jgi:hypothetical protein
MKLSNQWLFEAPFASERNPCSNGENSSQTYEATQANKLGQREIDQAIRAAERKMQFHYNLRNKYAAGAGKANNGTAARQQETKYWEWSRERDFLERLKAVHEFQVGVPLNYKSIPSPHSKCESVVMYPVTKKDPNTGKSKKNNPYNPWRLSPRLQSFCENENDGSFCLGASRGMAFRHIFGLDKLSNLEVLKDLKKKIEAAKAKKDTATEAKLLISRIVSHSHDPGSVKQFNQDLESRYGIKNVMTCSTTERKKVFAALKQGAPIIADLDGGWHWVLVQKSPLGNLWANDPLLGYGVRKILASELGSRFELVVDAKTFAPITPNNADIYKK